MMFRIALTLAIISAIYGYSGRRFPRWLDDVSNTIIYYAMLPLVLWVEFWRRVGGRR